VLEAIRRTATYRKIRVIVLSAVPAVSAVPADGIDGCTEYIQKPVSFDRLLHLLQAVHASVGEHRSSI
jgi:DNA-binding NtrC family response regulator